jgi:hypothetical protein
MHGDEMRSTRVDLRILQRASNAKLSHALWKWRFYLGICYLNVCSFSFFFLYMWREVLGVVERHRIVVRVGSCVTGGDRHDLQFLEHANVGRVRNRRRQTSNSF